MVGVLIILGLIAISSIPVVAVYFWFRIAKYEFTLRWFLFVLLAGATAFLPAILLQNLLNFSISSGGRLELFYQFFVRIASTEELSRLLLLLVFFRLSSRIAPDPLDGQEPAAEAPDESGYASETPTTTPWNTVKKGAAAGLVAGLGFAILESAVYGASNADVFGVLLLRTVTAAPLHAACGARVGMAAVMFRLNPVQALSRLLAAVAIHGIYNFMIIMPGFMSAAAVLIALITLASSIAVISSGWSGPEDRP
jgi:RsiW-degrading membrane proteinase PrsW (M82 family)